MILGMSFLKISNVDMLFGKETLTWKFYTTNEALLTTKQVQIVDLKELIIAAFNADSETFVVHVTIWEQKEMPVHLEKQVQVGALLFDEASIEVLAEYSDYSNVFSVKNVAKVPENTGINEYAIELEESKQPLFGPIYNLGLVELEILKIYIKINLANGFIRPSKTPVRVLIFFNRKPDKSFRLCENYWDLDNIIIKNRYLLLLIGKSLDWLSQARRFIQLDLTSVYHRMRICEGDE